jgi:hypothetical protein
MVSGEFHSPDLLQAENEGYLVMHKPLNIAELHAILSLWLGRGHASTSPST